MLGTLQDKLIAGALGVALTISVSKNVGQWFEVRDLTTANATLDRQINDPETGYVTRLATCRGNQQALELAIETQNRITAEHAARSATALANATAAVAEAQGATARAQREATAILNSLPTEGDVCERLLSVDAQVMETVQ